ncbi:hypothetical protein QAD02_016714 [Eretmocerus hayati]|uniref:Uncharacterized protein n=1 Tax=Eretmocerus hayati TaxID=131215 RepID=A0ACC2PBW6_9HYME|nr:hypothetical protein QAD02_016714 [Eretmocerus hayati]
MAKTVDIEAFASQDSQNKAKIQIRVQTSKQVPQARYQRFVKDPLRRNRVVTDPAFVYFSVVILLVWIGFYFSVAVPPLHGVRQIPRATTVEVNTPNVYNSYYGFHNYRTPAVEYDYEYYTVDLTDQVLAAVTKFYHHGGFFVLTLTTLITQMLIIGLAKLLSLHPKLCARFGLGALYLSVMFWILTIILTTCNAIRIPGLIFLNLPFTVALLIVISVLTSVETVGVEIIAEIIQKTCQSLLCHRFLLLFSILILLLQALVACTVTIVTDSHSISVSVVIIVLGGLHLIWCIQNFGSMVISEAVATWHSKEDEKSVPKNVLMLAVKSISRYHLGSMCLQATFIWPLCLSIAAAVRSKSQDSATYSVHLSRAVCKLILILDTALSSLIEVAVNGYDFDKATSVVYSLVTKHSFLFLSVTSITHIICCYASILIILMFSIAYQFAIDDNNLNFTPDVIVGALAAIVYSILNAWSIMSIAVQTTLLCSMESYEEDEAAQKSICRDETESYGAVASAPTLSQF